MRLSDLRVLVGQALPDVKYNFLFYNYSMQEYRRISEENQQRAHKIIEDLRIIPLWQEIGAEVNLVGSLRTGLLVKHRDIDFHVYTKEVSLAESFSVILKLSKMQGVRRFCFKNLLDTDEQCLEWHLTYTDADKKDWQIDIIHMPKGSKYDGYFEKFAERLLSVMTDEERETILRLKYETPDDDKIAGVEYYRAVIEGKVRTLEEFNRWCAENPLTGISEWMPN